MLVCGVDIGSSTSKAVVLNNNHIVSWSVLPTTADSTGSGEEAIYKALRSCNLSLKDVQNIVSTGYGRVNVPLASKTITEISCHARGTHWLFPKTRTILDMGGQDCKAIKCDEKGKVVNFVMNDKCAAGTGRYLEGVAAILGLGIEEIGPRSLQTIEGVATISSYCAVFAENDVLQLLRDGRHPNDILAGACEAIVQKIISLLNRIGGIEEDFSISGGIAKNTGVVRRLESALMTVAHIAPEPQIVGAIGAAIFAQEFASK